MYHYAIEVEGWPQDISARAVPEVALTFVGRWNRHKELGKSVAGKTRVRASYELERVHTLRTRAQAAGTKAVIRRLHSRVVRLNGCFEPAGGGALPAATPTCAQVRAEVAASLLRRRTLYVCGVIFVRFVCANPKTTDRQTDGTHENSKRATDNKPAQ